MQGRLARSAVNTTVAMAVFLAAFGLYVVTGPSDVAWMAGAEYQRRVVQADIGEGPWHQPLFVSLSQPFLALPWDGLARRANWAAAFFAAGACLFVYLLMKMLLQMAPQFIARRVGVLAAVTLGVSHTLWMRAVTPGPEPLDACLLAAMLFFLIRFANIGGAHNLYLGSGILGLSFANNLLMLFVTPIVLLYARFIQPPLTRNPGAVRLRGLVVFLVTAALGLGLTASTWFARQGFTIPAEQWEWLTFWNRMSLTWTAPLQESLTRFGTMLLLNFPPWTALVGVLGLFELYRRQKYVFWLVFPMFVLYGFLVATLDLEAPIPSYLPVWTLFSLMVGFGWWRLLAGRNWKGFAAALLLSASPAVVYRFAPVAVRYARMELRARALLDVPLELPLDPLAFQLNPDRRKLPQAREFALNALQALPEQAIVISPSRASELVLAPMRYVAEVEGESTTRFVSMGTDAANALGTLTADLDTSPVFAMGLHPPHEAVTALLSTHHFRAEGYWFRLVSKNDSSRVLDDRPLSGARDDALDDSHLVGLWYGYVEPQGYPLSLDIVGGRGNLSGTAVLNAEGARPWQASFTRLSSTVGTVLGSAELGEPNGDKVHFHIDARQTGNKLQGSWSLFEIPRLAGTFVVWKQESNPPLLSRR
ncbi:MAG TPA: DUF2723 domain-containing protein [Vicinamibacteria bacterium]|nr:DUF2723 domain-containing protein [Vicinamibacteria bacterium]